MDEFWINRLYSCDVHYLIEIGCNRAKWLYLGKIGFVWSKFVLFGQISCRW